MAVARSLLEWPSTVKHLALLTARSEQLGPHVARAHGMLTQSPLAFPEWMLGPLLPHICIFGFAIGGFYFHSVCDRQFPTIRKRKLRPSSILVCL